MAWGCPAAGRRRTATLYCWLGPPSWPADGGACGLRPPPGGTVTAPVPERAAVCGDPAASSTIDRLADLLPLAAGVNVTETVHVPPAASVVIPSTGQVEVCAKSAEFAPASEIELTSSGAPPVL